MAPDPIPNPTGKRGELRNMVAATKKKTIDVLWKVEPRSRKLVRHMQFWPKKIVQDPSLPQPGRDFEKGRGRFAIQGDLSQTLCNGITKQGDEFTSEEDIDQVLNGYKLDTKIEPPNWALRVALIATAEIPHLDFDYFALHRTCEDLLNRLFKLLDYAISASMLQHGQINRVPYPRYRDKVR